MELILQLFPQGAQDVIGGILDAVYDVWLATWWIAAPLISFFIFWTFWVLYVQFRFISEIQWILLELKVPRDVMKTPKAMEQVFAAAHAPYSYGLRFLEKYWEGKVEYWFSFELVGHGGEVHFYLRLPKQFRNLMESAIYAQYPEAEITQVASDYVREMPRVLPNKTFDIWGAEFVLKAADCYPIRTYDKFEETTEERRVDPVAEIVEVMSKLKAEEQIWLQFLVRPTGDEWKKACSLEIEKLTGKGASKSGGFLDQIGDFIRDLMMAPFVHPPMEVKKKDETQALSKLLALTPGEKEMLEGIERKTAKLGFETTIRFIYIDRRDSFSRDNVAAVLGFFRQFNTQNLNLLRPNKATMTAAVHGLFKNLRLNYRKRVMFDRYRDLAFGPKKSILNIEELATIYHFPITGVKPPKLGRLEFRKGGPPSTLPFME